MPGDQELIEIAEAAPNAAAAVIKLFRAYREQAERLSDLTELLAREGSATALSGARLPIDEVREVFERRPNHFADIEEEAEAFTSVLDPGDDLFAALKAWLKREHGIVVKVLPVATMPNWRRRYDRHSQRLFLSERLSPFDQLREVAMEACLIRMTVAVAAEIAGAETVVRRSPPARPFRARPLRRARADDALCRPSSRRPQRARYDVDVLRSRFGVSFEQAANRLTMLQRPGASGVPFFMLEIDNAGNRFRRAGAQGFPHSRFRRRLPEAAGPCGLRASPARFSSRRSRCPTAPSSCASRARWKGRRARSRERPRRTALLLGCDIGFRDEIVYGAALAGVAGGKARSRAPPRRSARPAGSASASAASPAPSRR